MRVPRAPWLVAGVVALHVALIGGAWERSQSVTTGSQARAGPDRPPGHGLGLPAAAPLRVAMAGGLPTLDLTDFLAPRAEAPDEFVVGASTPAAGPGAAPPADPQLVEALLPTSAARVAAATPSPNGRAPDRATDRTTDRASADASDRAIGNAAAAVPTPAAAPGGPAATVVPTVGHPGIPPVYRARPPDAATLHFSLRRGNITGRGQLQWQPQGDRYTLLLRGTVLGFDAITQDSRGTLGASGLAPERFVDTRRGRAAMTARFDRQDRLIHFTRVPHTHPLLPGAQDRVSWMLQLPSILRAEPGLHRPGAQVDIFVAGARGDGDIWEFVAVGRETLQTNAGPIAQAEHWRRRPRSDQGTRVDVWFDPQQQWLPVKVRMQSGGTDGEFFELILERIDRG
jgi:hypothetical protein